MMGQESNLGKTLEERNLHKYMKKKLSNTSLRLRRRGGGAWALGEEWLEQEKGEEEAGFIGRGLLVPVGVTNRD
jgi:hypothetical protein